MASAEFVYSEDLTRNILREGHVLQPVRLRLVYELLSAYGVFERPGAVVIEPRAATPQELMTFHGRDYVEAVQAFSRGDDLERQHRYGFSDWGDNPITPGIFEAAALAAGGSLEAVDAVLAGRVDVAFNAGGGFHHAGPDFASGFCVFNDAVLAIQRLLTRSDVTRVAYVDIDAHHGDGVQNAFLTSDRVLTISLHESGQFLFPGTGSVDEVGVGRGEGYAVNLPLAPETDDETYLWAFREVVPSLIRGFQPDVLVTQLGIDTHRDDPLTHLRLTSKGHVGVVNELRALSPGRWIALGGGGYDLSAVARCWALDFGVMAGVESDLSDEIPAQYAERYGIQKIRDAAETRSIADPLVLRAAEDSVEQIKTRFFRRFGV